MNSRTQTKGKLTIDKKKAMQKLDLAELNFSGKKMNIIKLSEYFSHFLMNKLLSV